VSLILEALKKLEREKQAPDKGFLVVAHVPWASGERARSRGLLAIGIVTVAALGGAGLWLARSRPAVVSRPPGPAAVTPPAAPASRPPAPPASISAPPSRAADPTPATGVPRTWAKAPAATPAPALPRPATSVAGAAPKRSLRLPAAAPVPPAPTSEAPEVELRLNAISERDGQPVAVLNDRLVREGDAFDGIRVLRIGATEVEVEVKGRRVIVRF
jgi:hypothetical protein